MESAVSPLSKASAWHFPTVAPAHPPAVRAPAPARPRREAVPLPQVGGCSAECQVMAPCGFDLHFSTVSDIELLFHVFVGYLYVFCRNVYSSLLPNFINQVTCFC